MSIKIGIGNIRIGTQTGSIVPPASIYDPVLGWMILLMDVDGIPIKDNDGEYIYVKIE
jgi:hypothetical protein